MVNIFTHSALLLLLLTLLGALAALSAVALPPAEPLDGDDAEEPDFFFLTGGPYTQKSRSPQFIWGGQRFRTATGALRSSRYAGAGRFEWGLTDRWEADFEFGVLAEEDRSGGLLLRDVQGPADLLAGVRYRLLDESFAPFTLSLGPQVSFPASSRRKGLGTGKTGYALDLAAAKDWGGPVFVAASLNASTTSTVAALPDGSGPRFDVSQVDWAGAVGIRALERPAAGGSLHDLHAFLEISGTRSEGFEAGDRVRTTPWFFSPGIRYGFFSRSGALTEIGFALPVGLNNEAADWGFIVQLQFEMPSLGGP